MVFVLSVLNIMHVLHLESNCSIPNIYRIIILHNVLLLTCSVSYLFFYVDLWNVNKISISIYWPLSQCTWSDNKVCELAVCLPWQHWTKALVWFDDDISAFHSCVVVDLWQSLSEWHLLLSACVLVCCRKNVAA